MKSLAAKHTRALAIRSKLEQLDDLEPRLGAREKELAAGFDITGDVPGELLSVRAKLAAIPHQRAQLEAELTAIVAEVDGDIQIAKRQFSAVAAAKEKALRAQLISALSPLIPDIGSTERTRLLEESLRACAEYRVIYTLHFPVDNPLIGPIGVAGRLLELQKLAGL